MPAFRYKATNGSRKVFNGVVEADTLADAHRRLESRGLKPLQVQPAVLRKPRRLVSEAPPRRVWPWVLLALAVVGGAAAYLFTRP